MSIFNSENSFVWTVGNPHFEKFLRTPVPDFTMSSVSRKDLDELIKHMRHLMVLENGVGLSANQIGLPIRLFVCQLPSTRERGYQGKFYAIFNPRIIYTSEKKLCDQEGCLSIPGLSGEVERFYSVRIEGFDKNNRPVLVSARGLLARIMQHEIDHLNGVLFTDRTKNIHRSTEL
ncbi:MAG: peptide deformylase [Candidatus Paceibacterota bacterium]